MADATPRLASGELAFETMVFEFDSPGLARVVADAGAEFIVLGMEHVGWSVETIKRQIAHARGAGVTALANPPGAWHDQICRPLDLGALGAMAPARVSRCHAPRSVGHAQEPDEALTNRRAFINWPWRLDACYRLRRLYDCQR
jgi:2-keto-3-deoxy-L-rhamnonate aldolase RhmA